MKIDFDVLQASFWSLTYVLIIFYNLRHHILGIPPIAILANFAWETAAMIQEFVRMLTDLTPANTIEVLIVAIARHVILSHDDPLSNLACVACIAGLFATRRFLIPKQEMNRELSETEEYSE